VIHAFVATLALAGIVVAYGRATYVAVAIVVPVLLLLLPRLRSALFSVLPIIVPFLILFAIALPHIAPSVGSTFSSRVLKSNSSDVNIRWRKAAAGALWEEVHQSPITGVGFGKTVMLRFEGVPMTVDQDPHDSFLYLLAGGGVLTLSGYLLLVLTFAVDAVVRLRRATEPYQRLIIIWSMATLFAFLVNAAAGPVLSDPRMLLTIWAVMLLPSSIGPVASEATTRMRARAAEPQAA
jgi:O-antigen ligase